MPECRSAGLQSFAGQTDNRATNAGRERRPKKPVYNPSIDVRPVRSISTVVAVVRPDRLSLIGRPVPAVRNRPPPPIRHLRCEEDQQWITTAGRITGRR